MTKKPLHDIIHSFKHNEGAKVTKPPVRHRKEKALALPDLPPSIEEGLTVLFIGFNPGVQSSKTQHHYAHPTNLFWRLFNALGVFRAVWDARFTDISGDCDIASDIAQLRREILANGAAPRHDFQLVHCGIGFTDLVLRCTKQALELSVQEKLDGVPRLFSEFNTAKAPFLVFIGKGIWETFCRFLGEKSRDFEWGLQREVASFLKHCSYTPSVYVFPSTSGLVALMKYDEKLRLWHDLVGDIGVK